ncbi:threonine--tRNA ligase, partial [Candidatus Uhrbacteria bacterium]|nr:threonine--tRNA ligase [Candidatus Uhrbacteria bacterium]
MPYTIETIRHSTAHLLAAAVQELWPQAKLGVGPVIEHGFYYDFDLPTRLTEKNFQKIEKQMRAIIARKTAFTREEMPIDAAIVFFEKKNQPYKMELLRDLKTKGTTAVRPEETQEFNAEKPTQTSVYHTGKFVDLCRGPHVADTSALGVFKLMRVAGAYWRGNEKNPQLQRVYGIAFATQKELDDHCAMLVEAEKRDHRKLGQELELFTFDDMVGKGLPLWLPNGTLLKDCVEDLAKREEAKDGYLRVSTPHLAKEALFKTSGHLPYYKDSMYPGMVMDDGTYYLKAMNCPHHHIIYKAKPRSYRDLPLRLAEYGTVYRNGLSGTLAGLLRVRMLSMNDAHIYCRQDQIEAEFTKVIRLMLRYFTLFDLHDYWFRLSKWDATHTDKYINEPENWEYAEGVLRSVLKKLKVKFVEAENEAAFYGPKVDVMFRSVIGREETMSTVQLDFAAKKRFDLTFTNEKGEKDNGVFVIHRAPLSTHERFIAFLIEHYAGAFPVWLAPVQVAIIPVSDDHMPSAGKLSEKLREEGIRVSVDGARDTVGYKIRKAEKQKVPYMIVIGDKEKSLRKLAVRVRGEKEIKTMTVSAFLKRLKKE